jgi:hypothetical protein
MERGIVVVRCAFRSAFWSLAAGLATCYLGVEGGERE